MYSWYEYFVNGMINQDALDMHFLIDIRMRIADLHWCIFDLGQEGSLFFADYNVQMARRVEESAWS